MHPPPPKRERPPIPIGGQSQKTSEQLGSPLNSQNSTSLTDKQASCLSRPNGNSAKDIVRRIDASVASLVGSVDRAIPCNSYYDHATDLSQDDIFTLAGITMFGPGLGKRVRERFVEIAASLMQKHGMRAFEMPKRAAAIHEAGHVVINSAVGVRTTSVLIDHLHRNSELFWIGNTEAPGLAFVDTPAAPAGFDKLLMKSRTTCAGIAAEMLFAGPDRREGSSLDEIIMSQIFAEMAASLIGVEPEALWQNDVWSWCMVQLHHNRNAHAGIADALMERKRLKGKALRDLCANVQQLSTPDEVWPDIHDHTSQLADAGILPDLEDCI